MKKPKMTTAERIAALNTPELIAARRAAYNEAMRTGTINAYMKSAPITKLPAKEPK